MTEPDHVIPFENLPEGFAETVINPTARPVEPRPAATIVLLRDGTAGLEVLLMRRSRRSGFVPGAYVFPGGRVDRADGELPSEDRLVGLTARDAEERLGLASGNPPAIAYYLAALREAFEETGILVARRSDGTDPATAADDPAVDAVRHEVMDDSLTFPDALERLDCTVPGPAIAYLAHWITPTPEPRRYDTRFFAAGVAEGATPIVDPREMTDALWIRPRAALQDADRGRVPMVFPTIKTLEQLEAFASVDEALAAIHEAPVRTILPTLVVTPTGIGMNVDARPRPGTD